MTIELEFYMVFQGFIVHFSRLNHIITVYGKKKNQMSLKLYLYSGETNTNSQLLRQRVSLIFLIAAIAHLLKQLGEGSFSLSDSSTLISLGYFFLNLVFYLSNRDMAAYGHVLLLLGATTLATFKEYDSIYGFIFWICAFLLAKRYRILLNRPGLLFIFFILYYTVIIELSLFLSPRKSWGIMHISFLVSFILFIYYLFKSELKRFSFSEQRMQNSIHELIKERTNLKNHIAEKQSELTKLEKQIESIQGEKEPFDLDKIGLTPAELRIVEALVKTRGTNKEISEQLGIKENTVKQHLYKVFNKMGVDERFQIIDLCKYNFD